MSRLFFGFIHPAFFLLKVRELSGKRAKEISKYCEDPDAAFPTPIILAVTEADIKSISPIDGLKDIYMITFDDSYAFAEILDGQHRVEGIKLAKAFLVYFFYRAFSIFPKRESSSLSSLFVQFHGKSYMGSCLG